MSKDYVIEPKGSIEVFRFDTPTIPEVRDGLLLFNNGMAKEVKAIFYWSHSFTNEWFPEGSIIVSKGENKLLTPPSNSFYYSKYIIYNNTNERAYISAYLGHI